MAGVVPSKLSGDLAQAWVSIPAANGGTGVSQKIVSLGEWEMTKKSKMVDATDTDSQGAETSVPSTSSWSISAKWMYVDGDPGQQAALLDTINTQNQAGQVAPTWHFYPTIATGRDEYVGQAWVESVKVATGIGKLVATDVTLRGQGLLVRQAQTSTAGA